jgi:hypothetical protein
MMLNSVERKILEIINSRLLITEGELLAELQKVDIANGDAGFQRLQDTGLIDKVRSLGTCIVITQKGMRALREK